MDTIKIKNLFNLFDADVDYNFLTTLREELNRQCNLILVPSAVVAILSWLPYIPLDYSLFLEMPLIIVFRLGFTLAGVIALILHFFPYFKKENYWLLFSLICYLELVSAIIAGAVNADPAYMGGYAMLILVIPLMPFKIIHSIAVLSSSVFLFILTALITRLHFDSWGESYGLYNMVSSVVSSFIGIFVLDNIRKVSYEKNKLNYITNMELKVATMEIFQINEELKKADKLKSQLLEIAATDLKNPLQDIMACTQIIKDEVKEEPASIRRLNVIHRSTENMLNLITKLLKSLSIDRGKLVLKKSDVDIGDVFGNVIEINKPQLEKKNQKIFFNAEERCMVVGDKILLKEIFDNLLSNAVKFSYPGKSIWVNVSRNSAGVSVKVRDEGPGLSENDKKNLFIRFRKLSAKPTGGESSTGLGLAITMDLVEMHNGKIKVESEPGRGCAFIVDLPKVTA
jgi:signal transduction histidine kinase